MGLLCAKESVSEVDKDLIRQRMKALYDFKVLVLGAGESGKSTVVKQIRLIHKGKAFTETELQRFRDSLRDNVIDCMSALVQAADTFNIAITEPKHVEVADQLRERTLDRTLFTHDVAETVFHMWKSEPIAQVMTHREKFWVLDSVNFYLENAERFAEEDFVPTEEDCIMARVRTTGIVTTEFNQKNPDSKNEYDSEIHWRVIDVGGQRNERKKWIHFFDDVKCILFVVNLAGYNMVLFEDDTQNRMHEALELFSQTIKKSHFQKTPVFLFLNKKDIFEESLKKVGLETCFPDYKGPNTVNDAMNFVAEKFRAKMPEGNTHFHPFMIASRLKMDVKFSFNELKKFLLEWNAKLLEQEQKKMAKSLN